jgi:hypothetical protein
VSDRGHRGDGVRHQLAKGNILDGEVERVGLDARQLEQVVDQPGEPVGLEGQLLVVPPHVVVLDDHPVV